MYQQTKLFSICFDLQNQNKKNTGAWPASFATSLHHSQNHAANALFALFTNALAPDSCVQTGILTMQSLNH